MRPEIPDFSGLSFQKRKEKFISVVSFGEIPEIPAERIDERIAMLQALIGGLDDSQKDVMLYQYDGAAFANCFKKRYDPDGRIIKMLIGLVQDESKLVTAISHDRYKAFTYAAINSHIPGLETLLSLADRFQLSQDVVTTSQCLKQCVEKGSILVMELFLVKLPGIVTREVMEQKVREREAQQAPYNRVSEEFKLHLRNPALDHHIAEIRAVMEREHLSFHELSKSDKYPVLPPIPYEAQVPARSILATSATRADRAHPGAGDKRVVFAS